MTETFIFQGNKYGERILLLFDEEDESDISSSISKPIMSLEKSIEDEYPCQFSFGIDQQAN